jgi:hypothetical protein
MMRKTMLAMSVAATAAFAAPAFAQPAYYSGPGYPAAVPWVAGAAVGTVVGVGLHEGWFSGAFASSLPSSAAGAAVAGGVAGVGTVALLHAAMVPCQGFQALFNNFLTHTAAECGGAPRR